jgi:hypothetical protein
MTIIKNRAARRAGVGVSAVAAASLLMLGLGEGAAHADTPVTFGHFDIAAEVHCDINGDAVIDEVVLEQHPGGPFSGDIGVTGQYAAPSALTTVLGLGGTPANVPAADPADTSIGLEVGYSVEYDEDSCGEEQPEVCFTWDSFNTNVTSPTNPGRVAVWDHASSTLIFNSNGLTGSLCLGDSSPWGIHKDFVFAFNSGSSGDWYELQFEATATNSVSQSNTLRFVF